jgi:hypothetical protein
MKVQRQKSAPVESHKSNRVAAIVVVILSTWLIGGCSLMDAPSNYKKGGAGEPEVEFTEARLAKISKDLSAYIYVVNESPRCPPDQG